MKGAIEWVEDGRLALRSPGRAGALGGAEGKKQRAELTGAMTDRLIDERLIEQAARQRGGEANDAQVNAEMARIIEQLGGGQGLQAALAPRNLTLAGARQIPPP